VPVALVLIQQAILLKIVQMPVDFIAQLVLRVGLLMIV
jgi:hypothetical protein